MKITQSELVLSVMQYLTNEVFVLEKQIEVKKYGWKNKKQTKIEIECRRKRILELYQHWKTLKP